jgi:hypothetical protein
VTNCGPERVIVQPLTNVEDRIAAFCTAFTALRQAFDSKLALNSALVLSRAAITIEAISEYPSILFQLPTINHMFLRRTRSIVVETEARRNGCVLSQGMPS